MKNIFFTFAILFSCFSLKAQVFQEWAARYNGPDSLTDLSLAIDVHGCLYVTGVASVSNNYHIVTLRYSKSGVLLWSAVNTNAGSVPFAIVVDNNCNAYITGSIHGGGNNNFITVKYDSTGSQKWENIYDGPSQGFDIAGAIVLDNTGSNVYVSGTSENSSNITTIKYNSNGVLQWISNYQSPISNSRVFAMVVDAGNNIYITGYSVKAASSGTDYTTLKYNPFGSQQWVAFYNGTGNGSDQATGIALDSYGNIYITGGSYDSIADADYATVKYNNNGIQQWVARYNGPGNSRDNALSIVVDKKGNVNVIGNSHGMSSNYDYATIQYNKNGVIRWVQRYNGPANQSDNVSDIALDNAGNVYVTGFSTGNGTLADYTTIKYKEQGNLEWVQRYNGTANGYDIAVAIAIDANADVYITGYSAGVGTGLDFASIKYTQRNFPPGYNGVTKNNKFDILEFVNIEAYTSLMDTLINQVNSFTGDNGNTQALLDIINSSTPPGQIKNQLIVSSPLTDTVLIATINSGLPTGHKKDILLANTSFSDRVDRIIIQSSLPNNIKNNIIRAGDSDFIIENIILDKFEQLLKFKSLRTDIQDREAQYLKNGGDPENSSSPNHHFIEDDFMRSFFNPLIEVKIGNEIIKYLNDSTLISITDGDFNTLKQIRQTGKIPRFTPPATEPANGIPISQMPPIIPANIRVENTFVDPSTLKQFVLSDFAAYTSLLNVIFINNSSGPVVLSYYWDFGDGYGSYQMNPSHTYASGGSFLVTLTVTGGNSQTSIYSQTVNVASCNASWNHTSNGLSASFSDASAGIGTLTYSWDFDDPTSISNTSTLSNPSHTFSAGGVYHVCLTIVDGAACLETSCKDITIYDPATDKCCDKNDRVVEKWNQYASDRKAKAVIKLRNATFLGIHYLHGKTNNYKRNFLNAWVPKKTDGIYVYFEGTVYQTSQNQDYHTDCVVEASQQISVCAKNANYGCPPQNCCFKQDDHDADAKFSNGGNNFIDRIFLKQNSIISTHKVLYQGTEYESGISPLSITEDCD